MTNINETAMKINKPHLILVLVSFGLVVSGCDNIKKCSLKCMPKRQLLKN